MRIGSSALLCSFAALVGCSAAPPDGAAPAKAAAPSATLQPAAVVAVANARCQLHAVGDTTDSVPVLVGDDGIARFHTLRAAADSSVEPLTLDCTDERGVTRAFTVDPRDEALFGAHATTESAVVGARKALTGDPMRYSQGELIRAGYGFRPDPTVNPDGYRRWLASATAPARQLKVDQRAFTARKPYSQVKPMTTIINGTAPNWTGAVLVGAPSLPATAAGAPSYVMTEATFNVPAGIPSGDRTGNTGISIWNGLGGFGTGGGLIQSGIQMFTSTTSASYIMFREYCCGDGPSNNYTPTFTPAPGDSIFSEDWYCDANGEFNVNGGYGCSFMHDITQNAYFTCVSPSDTSCASVAALSGFVVGKAAEFIIELEVGPAFTDFSPGVTISGTAGVAYGNSSTISLTETINNDPTVWQLGDFTQPQSSEMNVSLGSDEQVNFDISCVPLTCGGSCGRQSNGCGGILNCPACPPPTCHTPQLCCIQNGCSWRSNRCICI